MVTARKDANVATAIKSHSSRKGIEKALNATLVRVDGTFGESIKTTLVDGMLRTVLQAAGVEFIPENWGEVRFQSTNNSRKLRP